jgi:hypothetical protein
LTESLKDENIQKLNVLGKRYSTLKTLDLRRNQLTDASAPVIGAYMKDQIKVLQVINLS